MLGETLWVESEWDGLQNDNTRPDQASDENTEKLTAMNVRLLFIALALATTGESALPSKMERVIVSADHKGFTLQPSGHSFVPWGVNYGNAGRLMEDFWDGERPVIEADFAKMKKLGANLARVHLQFSKFMTSADTPDAAALEKLKKLVSLAEKTGIYLDLTGLACYRTADVPAWYDDMNEKQRWAAQCVFWHAVANACHGNDAVFCYDLMNEPMVPGGPDGKWYSGKPFGGYDFLQSISRDLAGRKRPDLAGEWIDTLTKAIREADKDHLITVGMLPWVEGWGHLFGFVPKDVAPHVDFLSVHLYPESAKPANVRKALSECAGHNRPVVIEETFPLSCTPEELEVFLKESRATACGWVWHYDGLAPDEYDARAKGGKLSVQDSIWQSALRLFVRMRPVMIPTP